MSLQQQWLNGPPKVGNAYRKIVETEVVVDGNHSGWGLSSTSHGVEILPVASRLESSGSDREAGQRVRLSRYQELRCTSEQLYQEHQPFWYDWVWRKLRWVW